MGMADRHRKGAPCELPMGMQNSAATSEVRLAVSNTVKHTAPQFHACVFTREEENLRPQVHTSVDDTRNLKRPKCPSAAEQIIKLWSIHIICYP